MRDPVLKEMHAIKDANARRYRGNVGALLRAVKKRESGSGRVVLIAPQGRVQRS